jgi:putative heme transporter
MQPAAARAARNGHVRTAGRRTTASCSHRAGPAVPRSLVVAAAWSWRLLAVGAVLWFLTTYLAGLTELVVPVILSLLLTALLHRPAAALRRWLPRWAAGLATLLGALALAAVVVWLVERRVQGQAADLLAQAGGILTQLRDRVATLPGIGSGSGSVVDRLNAWVQSHGSTVLTGVFTAGTVAVEVLTGFVLTLFLTLFLLIDGERIWAWLVRLLPHDARPAVNGAGHRAWHVLSGWIVGTALISLIHGIVIGTALWLIGTPLAVVLAVLVFLGSFVPIVGAFVFGGFACLVTLVTVGVRGALVLFAVLIVENLLEGHVYQPLIMGRSVKLHPIAVVLAVAAGGFLDGVVGAIIAIPLAGSVSAAVKYLRGIEDIHGNPLSDEDRMAPEPPPVALVPGWSPGPIKRRGRRSPAARVSPAPARSRSA